MTQISWDKTGERKYETGVDRGVLYIPDGSGAYTTGYAWNGLTTVTEKPTGAAATPKYADNIKYLNLISIEQYAASIDAMTYPDAWAQCDGSLAPTPGVMVGQQPRKSFGLSYRTMIGNDVDGTSHGYKLHLIYNAMAAPSQKAHATVNDTPEAMAFSWEISTVAINVPGYAPTATLTIDSTVVDPTALATLEAFLYGTSGTAPSLPTPSDVIALFAGTVNVAIPAVPSFASNVITIPTVAGLTYYINDKPVTGTVTITTNTVVTVRPNTGYKLPPVTDSDWLYTFA